MVRIEKSGGHAIVTLDHGKVNAIDHALISELGSVFSDLDSDHTVEGTILTGRPGGFSAGLDVRYLISCSVAEARSFWVTYMKTMQSMVRFSKPLVCAITGYAPAGATILTLGADYRIMARGEKYTIGMHEFKMSMQIPDMLCRIYAYQLKEQHAWTAVQKAQLFNSDEALSIGLVDESVELDQVMPRAIAHLNKLLQVHPLVYSQTKKYLRKELWNIVNVDLDQAADEFISFSQQPELIALVEQFAAMLGIKKA